MLFTWYICALFMTLVLWLHLVWVVHDALLCEVTALQKSVRFFFSSVRRSEKRMACCKRILCISAVLSTFSLVFSWLPSKEGILLVFFIFYFSCWDANTISLTSLCLRNVKKVYTHLKGNEKDAFRLTKWKHLHLHFSSFGLLFSTFYCETQRNVMTGRDLFFGWNIHGIHFPNLFISPDIRLRNILFTLVTPVTVKIVRLSWNLLSVSKTQVIWISALMLTTLQ